MGKAFTLCKASYGSKAMEKEKNQIEKVIIEYGGSVYEDEDKAKYIIQEDGINPNIWSWFMPKEGDEGSNQGEQQKVPAYDRKLYTLYCCHQPTLLHSSPSRVVSYRKDPEHRCTAMSYNAPKHLLRVRAARTYEQVAQSSCGSVVTNNERTHRANNRADVQSIHTLCAGLGAPCHPPPPTHTHTRLLF